MYDVMGFKEEFLVHARFADGLGPIFYRCRNFAVYVLAEAGDPLGNPYTKVAFQRIFKYRVSLKAKRSNPIEKRSKFY